MALGTWIPIYQDPLCPQNSYVSWYTHKRNFIYAHKKNMVLPLLTLMKTINTQQQCIQSLYKISIKPDNKHLKYGQNTNHARR